MRVSHSQGHTRRHQFQPGIITEPLGSLTVILAVIPQATTEPNQTGLNRNAAQPDLARPNWTVENRRLAVIS